MHEALARLGSAAGVSGGVSEFPGHAECIAAGLNQEDAFSAVELRGGQRRESTCSSCGHTGSLRLSLTAGHLFMTVLNCAQLRLSGALTARLVGVPC